MSTYMVAANNTHHGSEAGGAGGKTYLKYGTKGSWGAKTLDHTIDYHNQILGSVLG